MKRLILLIAAACAIAVAASACMPTVPPPPIRDRPEMLVVGDSLSAGTWGRTDPGKHWWQYVGEHLDARTTVSASPGWTSRHALNAGRPAGNFDVVFIELGSNDPVIYMDTLETRRNIAAIANWATICVVIAPWERTGFAAATMPPNTRPLFEYNLNAYRAALDNGCGFVNWADLRSDTPGWTWDGLHPTPTGNAYLGQAVINAVK